MLRLCLGSRGGELGDGGGREGWMIEEGQTAEGDVGGGGWEQGDGSVLGRDVCVCGTAGIICVCLHFDCWLCFTLLSL